MLGFLFVSIILWVLYTVSLPIVGTSVSFSLTTCFLPLTGCVFGVFGPLILMGYMIVKYLVCASFAYALPLYVGLPTISASLCWATESKGIRIGIPLVCMIAFLLHPVGWFAAPYTLYWLIPIICALYAKHPFFTALSSTFIAHAVGSVVHLYTVNSMDSAAWIGLIPRVFFERLMFAVCMYGAYCVVLYSVQLILYCMRVYRTLHR